jgi:hypothetical protein
MPIIPALGRLRHKNGEWDYIGVHWPHKYLMGCVNASKQVFSEKADPQAPTVGSAVVFQTSSFLCGYLLRNMAFIWDVGHVLVSSGGMEWAGNQAT